jgi:hypothetical protein
MLFVWLAIVLPPTLVFVYVALSGLFLLIRSGLQNPQSRRLAPLLVVLIISSGYLLSFHEASRPIWKGVVGPFVSQILLQLGSIILSAPASTSQSAASMLLEKGEDGLVASILAHEQAAGGAGMVGKNWLSSELSPIIQKEAHISHLVALFLGLFMSSYVTAMTDSLKKRKIPEYM